ncbi:MAG: NAD(P)H-dependent glycerol-3-phosphate dehydrogenase [Bacteroidia bacterium]|nr:NAD(P)H-dependent glycerol-3-phosphate dehydrogenase [Bacteroidia bacterium]
MNLKVGLLGGGSWGTTVAALTTKNCDTSIWARNPDVVDDINKNHRNEQYLPGAFLPEALKATYTIEETVRDADVIVMGIPAQSFKQVLKDAKPYIRPWVPIVSLAKGLENGSMMRMTEIIEDVMPGHPAGVLTGPNLAKEIAFGQAAASVIAMVDDSISVALQKVFRSGLFRVYTNQDVIGCELGGALKNIVALATGMGDGAGSGENSRAAIITRGLAELTRLGVAMGGRPETFAGLTGMGDLVATCTSAKSRNRTVGFELGKGRKIDEVIAEMQEVAEGVKTAKVVIRLASKMNIEMPIAKQVYKVLYEDLTVQEAFTGVLRRSVGSEAEPG